MDRALELRNNTADVRKATGDGCFDCDKTYWTNFEAAGSRKEVFEKCNKDSMFDAVFEQTTYNRKHADDTQPFFSSDVKRCQAQGARAMVGKRGLTEIEFKDVFGKTYGNRK